ncbi:unnamed protein product [Chironomus riparius]|uniref:Peptidase S1 domain-containing protein n=1 Tax=Chironomus riparius TaxID=315576 RepID=A0A9N9S0V5_9DIPT|nr:unnamed protein product [Chironomus riparius]
MIFKVFSFLCICDILLSSSVVFGESSGGNNLNCGKPQVKHVQTPSGSQVTRGAFPWNAALLTSDGEFFCSGTLISADEVVTAAGCIKAKSSDTSFQPKDIVVLLGFQNLKSVFEVGRLSVAVKSIRVHNDWNPQTASFDADIAILELDDNVNFGPYIQPICLFDAEADAASLKNASIVGFSSTLNGGVAKVPRLLDTPIVGFEKCTEEEGYRGLLSNRMICGGLADGTGPCFGDGGTGMIVAKNGVYYLRGITSATLINAKGCNNDAYSVFTDVLKFWDWMNELLIQ